MKSTHETVTLREYIEQRFTDNHERYEQRFLAQERANEVAMSAAKEAVIKAEISTDKRFDSVNEFRQTLADQTAGFMPRSEAEAIEKALSDQVSDLKSRMDKLEGSSKGANSLWVLITGGILLVASLVGVVFTILRTTGKP